MGQREVLEVLCNSKEWMTASQIYEKVKDKFGRCSVCNTLEAMSKHNDIERRKNVVLRFGYEYRYKTPNSE